MDRGDEGRVRRVHSVAERMQSACGAALAAAGLAQRRELLDVGAGDEGPLAGARSTIARVPVVAVEPVDLRLELVQERRRELVHGRVVDRDERDGALVLVLTNVPNVPPRLTATICRASVPHPTAAVANCSRRAVLRNLPTAVFGISSTTSNRSGSHHFAKWGARNSRSSSGSAVCPSRKTTTASGRSDHFSSGHGDHGRLLHGRVAHERVLERDRRDPLAARLDEVLRAVLDLDVAVRLDRDDVAGLEPAVVGPAVARLRRVVVRRRDPRSAHLELAHRGAVPGHETRRRRARGSRRTAPAAPAWRGRRTAPPRGARARGSRAPRSCPSGPSRSSPTRA